MNATLVLARLFPLPPDPERLLSKYSETSQSGQAYVLALIAAQAGPTLYFFFSLIYHLGIWAKQIWEISARLCFFRRGFSRASRTPALAALARAELRDGDSRSNR